MELTIGHCLYKGAHFRHKETDEVVTYQGGHKSYDGQDLISYIVEGHLDHKQARTIKQKSNIIAPKFMPKALFLEMFVPVEPVAAYVDIKIKESDAAKNDEWLNRVMGTASYMYGTPQLLTDTIYTTYTAAESGAVSRSYDPVSGHVDSKQIETSPSVDASEVDPMQALDSFKKGK